MSGVGKVGFQPFQNFAVYQAIEPWFRFEDNILPKFELNCPQNEGAVLKFMHREGENRGWKNPKHTLKKEQFVFFVLPTHIYQGIN